MENTRETSPTTPNTAAAYSDEPPPRQFRSTIRCGPEIYEPFFGARVQTFYALADPTGNKLFRGRDVATCLSYTRPTFGMLMLSRREDIPGIFQATGYTNKAFDNKHYKSLHIGSYFLSLSACHALSAIAMQRKRKKEGKEKAKKEQQMKKRPCIRQIMPPSASLLEKYVASCLVLHTFQHLLNKERQDLTPDAAPFMIGRLC